MNKLPKEPFPDKPRLIYMGTPEFALHTLRRLIQSGHEIRAVVTQPDRPWGRGRKMMPPPVKRLAREHNLEVLQPERASDPAFCELIKGKNPDLIIVIAFGQILKKTLLDIPRWGVMNIHASLLPKYRGAAPMQWAIINNEPTTGLTVMHMDEGLDTGPILYQKEVSIGRDETIGQLHDRLALKAGDMMVEYLNDIAGKRIKGTPQDDALATYAPKIERRDCAIDWSNPASEVSARIRALDPMPGAYTTFEGTSIKLFGAHVMDDRKKGGAPGRVSGVRDGNLVVDTGMGVIRIDEIQYPGKKRLPVRDFLRGFSLSEGTILGL